ncbi:MULTISPECIES: hypothetical protein [unclassified Microcystis]|jgi:hypothetical protein|uniref:hypothetical protein n=1 Tax=unclassified Microcystis TaxID=2643300 RepID=UPI0022C1B2C7|nr:MULTISPECIES: hypothetical protein [unclassified Microcystis]MCA2692178.1 hypothetical protein [Microcystis sp. M034S2]MCA2752749.1 hypothetical protein [Microcystis sp. M144S2]MCZ8202885.1 hypothetical protein [Microcystis sp. LE19-55.1A]MCZ8307652.1 hypothetical protein [Microcystis sp. LE19-98.1E]
MTWALQKISIPAQVQGNQVTLAVAQGTVVLTDIGHGSVAGLPKENWGVLINWRTKAWVFGYEGADGSTLGLNVDENGNLHPSGVGTVTEIKYTA